MRTYKILGLLLIYPDGKVLEAPDELSSVLRSEDMLPDAVILRLERFMKRQSWANLMDIQEDYVGTFDRGRAHCLNLFEHVHGESRDRGQAMVDLMDTYASKGLFLNSRELPDYLPVFLEYLSLCDLDEASALLGETIDVIAMIGTKLKKRKSPYADVFSAIEALSAVKPNQKRVKEALESVPRDPQTLEELDEEWREAEAFTGDPLRDAAQGCNAFPTATRALEKMMGETR